MRLPTYDELASVEEQLQVLEHPLDQSLFVAGPPGSGKTVLALQRAQMIAAFPPRPPRPRPAQPPPPPARRGRMAAEDQGSVPIVTYNRMLRRLLALMQDIDAVAPSTMQSFIWRDYCQRTEERELPTHPHDAFKYKWEDMLDHLRQAQSPPDCVHLVVDEGQDLPEGFFLYVSRHVARTMTVFADDDQALEDQRTTLEQIKNAAGLDRARSLKPYGYQ